MNERGVYGSDDVPWHIQEARDIANDAAYRANKEAIDTAERVAIKTALLLAHESDGAIYQDGDNGLHIGFERNGRVAIFADLHLCSRTISFLPLSYTDRLMVKWSPLSQCIDDIFRFRKIAEKGCV